MQNDMKGFKLFLERGQEMAPRAQPARIPLSKLNLVPNKLKTSIDQIKSKTKEIKDTLKAAKAEADNKVEKFTEQVELDEASNVQKMGRKKLIRARVRGGKVQRRKVVSAVKGYTMRGGKLTRMTSSERLKRKISQRKAKIKRKAKAARALMKRKRSLRKRTALGLK